MEKIPDREHNEPPARGGFVFKGGAMKRWGTLILVMFVLGMGYAFIYSCGGGGGGGDNTVTLTGTVKAPGGTVAFLQPTRLQRFLLV